MLDTEEIAIRIFEDDEVGTDAVAPGIPASAQASRLATSVVWLSVYRSR
jgi:hypothetical protein